MISPTPGTRPMMASSPRGKLVPGRMNEPSISRASASKRATDSPASPGMILSVSCIVIGPRNMGALLGSDKASCQLWRGAAHPAEDDQQHDGADGRHQYGCNVQAFLVAEGEQAREHEAAYECADD